MKKSSDELGSEQNYAIILFLLEMNYHLLNSHFANSSIMHYVNMYAGDKHLGSGKEKSDKLKKEIKILFKISKLCMDKDAKKLIRCYRSNWKCTV